MRFWNIVSSAFSASKVDRFSPHAIGAKSVNKYYYDETFKFSVLKCFLLICSISPLLKRDSIGAALWQSSSRKNCVFMLLLFLLWSNKIYFFYTPGIRASECITVWSDKFAKSKIIYGKDTPTFQESWQTQNFEWRSVQNQMINYISRIYCAKLEPTGKCAESLSSDNDK